MSVKWEEVEVAQRENRRELVLSGKQIQTRILAGGLDQNIFKLVSLNYLDISEAGLELLTEEVGNLVNLGNLVLKGNCLMSLPPAINKLTKLKLLDVSKNKLATLPDISGLDQLSTLNVSLNKLTTFPEIGLEKCVKLSLLDLSVNDLTDISVLENTSLEFLAELNLSRNSISSLSGCIKDTWSNMKKLDLGDNKLNAVPIQLGELGKLKELCLTNNPLADNRLKKMAAQKSTKSVLEYIRQHGDKNSDSKGGDTKGKKGKKGKNAEKNEIADAVLDLSDRMTVMNLIDGNPEVYSQVPVKDVRPFIVICFVKNVNLGDENLRKFLQMQSKLHKGICANRTIATIATHDLANIKGPLKYTALEPESFKVEPLTGGAPVRASKLVSRLKKEADEMRKEKKRNNISGVHQFLPMLDRHPLYPCLMDAEGRVISFPPVTNSGVTRISAETKDLLIEVTSSTKLADAKLVADALLREMLEMGLGVPDAVEGGEEQTPNNQKVLLVEQGRVLDEGGALKVTYPSKADLVFEKQKFNINRI